MAFGDELRADDEVVGALRRGVELSPQNLDAARRVRGQHKRAYVRKEGFRLLRKALDARPASGERVGLVALRANLRSALDMAAMMANERGAKSVFDQPGGAIGTVEAMAAGSA